MRSWIISEAVQAPGSGTGCLSLLAPDLAGGGLVWFCVELQVEGNHQRFPLVHQVPFDRQLALFSLFGSDLMGLDELLIVLGPDGFHVVALSVVSEAYFRFSEAAPIWFIRGSSEVDAPRSSVQLPLKFGLSD